MAAVVGERGGEVGRSRCAGVIELSKYTTVPNSISFRNARGWLASARYTFGSTLRPCAAQAAASASRASELVPTSPSRAGSAAT